MVILVADNSVSAESSAGHALRMLRAIRNMSQQQVADAMVERGYQGWRQTTVAKTEAAQRPLRVNELVSLAAILDVSVEELIAPSSYRDLTATEARKKLTELRAQLIQLDEEIVQVKDRIAALAEEHDALTYSRNELAWIMKLLEQRLDFEPTD